MPHIPPDSPEPPPKHTRHRRNALPSGGPSVPPPWHSFLRLGLTLRESEVLWWVCQGKRDREIATILGLSHRTIHRHVCGILQKLAVENRAAAIARALPWQSTPEP